MSSRQRRYVINAVAAKRGGPSVYISNLVEAIARHGSPSSYFIFLPEEMDGRFKGLPANINITISRFANGSFLHRLVWDQIYLRYFAVTRGIDAVFCNGNFGMLLPPCRQILKVDNALYFSQLFLKDLKEQSGVYDRIIFYMRRALAVFSIISSGDIVTPSYDMAEKIRKVFKAKRVIPNPLGFNSKSFDRFDRNALLSAGDGDAVRIYASGHCNFHKNYQTLFKALPLIEKRLGRKALLLLTTDDITFGQKLAYGNTYRIKRLIDRHGLQDRIITLGTIAHNKMPKVYGSCDVYIQPSYAESFSHALVECMAFGLPRVVADTAIHREICRDAALYFSTFDEKDLARKCCSLLEDPKRCEALKRKGLERLKAFSWDTHAKKLIALLKEERP